MATQKVLLSTCDRCHTEVHSPLTQKSRGGRATYVLPNGWLNVSGNTATSTVFEMDLCSECKLTVLEAAGHAGSSRGKSRMKMAITDGQNRLSA